MNEGGRRQVLAALDHYVPPARLKKIERLLVSGDVRGAAENVVPSEMYLLAREMAPGDQESAIAQEMRRVAQESPENPKSPFVFAIALLVSPWHPRKSSA